MDTDQERTAAPDESGSDDGFRLHIAIVVAIIVLAGILTAAMEITAGNW